MGGRITRALYKNERMHSLRQPNKTNEIQQLSKGFSLVMSSVASFLLGYLFRPYSLSYRIDKQLTHTRQQQLSNNHSILFFISFMLIQGIILLFTTNSSSQTNQSTFLQVQKTNKFLITSGFLVFVIDVIFWIVSFQVQFLYVTLYGVIWICLGNICMYHFSCVKLIWHKRQFKQVKSQKCHTSRSIFIMILLALFTFGMQTSQHMKTLRVQSLFKQIVHNQQSEPKYSSFYQLSPQYQSHILASSHYQKFILRVIFHLLIFMIIVTVIAMQRKSMVHLIMFKAKAKEYRLVFQRLMMADDDKYNKRESINDKLPNLKIKRMVGFTFLYAFGLLAVQNLRRQVLSSQGSINYLFQDVNLSQSLSTPVLALMISYIVLRTSNKIKYQRPTQNTLSNENNSYGNRNHEKFRQLSVYTVIFVLLVVSNSCWKYLQQSNDPAKDTSLDLQLASLDILLGIALFRFISLSLQRLWRYPQASNQKYFFLGISLVFTIKFVVPDSILQLNGNFLIRSVIHAIFSTTKSIVYFFFALKNEQSIQPSIFQKMIYTQIFAFIITSFLLVFNDQSNLSIEENTDNKKRENHTKMTMVQKNKRQDKQQWLEGNIMIVDDQVSQLLKS